MHLIWLLTAFLLVLLCDPSASLRLIHILKTTSTIASGDPFPSTQSLTPRDHKKSVIILKENGKAVPFTTDKSGLSTAEFEKNPPEEIEEGVGPAASVDYSPATSLDEESDSSAKNKSEKDDDLKVEYSDVHPVYVKPPNDFKPRIFPSRRADGIVPGGKRLEIEVTMAPPARPYPYRYPNGLSSWLTGGIRGLQRGGFWESLASDESLHGYKPDREPVDITSWLVKPLLPLLPQKVIVPPSSSNYRPPFIGAKRNSHASSSGSPGGLPYPLGSWLFGGSQGLPSLSPWEIPSPFVIENIEFVPLNKERNPMASGVNQDLIADGRSSKPFIVSVEKDAKRDAKLEYYRRPLVTAAFLFDAEPEHVNLVNVEN